MRYQANPQFVQQLRKQMGRLNCGVADLAVMLNVSEFTLYHWLRGRAPHPLMQQAILARLENEEELVAYTPQEIAAAIKALRREA